MARCAPLALALIALLGAGCTALYVGGACQGDAACGPGACVEGRCISRATEPGVVDVEPGVDALSPQTTTPADEVKPDAPIVDADPTDPSDPSDPSDPAPAPFTFVPLYDTYCVLAGHAGYGVREVPGATRLLVRFLGGTRCWDPASCYDLGDPKHSGYDAAALAADVAALGAGILDRADQDNPFKDDHVVVIPDCTGDQHLGDVEHDDGRWHVGAWNAAIVIEALAARFAVGQVVVTGSGGAGLAAVVHAGTVADAFPQARVDVVNDQFPTLLSDAVDPAYFDVLASAWNLDALAPSSCPSCGTTWASWWGALRADHPAVGATIVIGRPSVDACLMQGVVASACDALVLDALDEAGVTSFVVDQPVPALLSTDLGALVVEGQTLGAFLAARVASSSP